MSAAPEISDITIREINELAEMRAVEELQKETWGIPDLDVVPLTQLVAAKEAGGVLIGAFDDETLVGFVYGFPSFEHGELAHHSHMLAVKPAYRNYDLGRRLKLAQREHVIAQGIGLISWTFDPLQSLNAHFNYGKFLHQTGTDRLWVSWLVSSERVKERLSGVSYSAPTNLGLPLVQVEADDSSRRNDLDEGLAQDHAVLEIPSNIDALPRETGLRWREDTRWAFTEALKAGYFVDGFVRETRGDKRIGKYILSRKKAHKAQKEDD
jgi:predicted GNAT superfamily acetyltransferase